MEIKTIYNGAQVLLNLEHTASSKTALLSANLTPRERQLLLLLDKGDEISVLAVSQLIGKLDIEKLVDQEILSITFQLLKDTVDGSKVAFALPNNQMDNTSAPIINDKPKVLGKPSRLQSFLSAYKTAEAENCSLEKCQSCDKVDECVTDTAELLNEVQLLNNNEVNRNEAKHVAESINPEFETIMIAQALIHVA